MSPDPMAAVNELSDWWPRQREHTGAEPAPRAAGRRLHASHAIAAPVGRDAADAMAGSLARYAKALAQILQGRSELAPDPKDRRFADPAWKGNFALQAIDAELRSRAAN
jgi:polyhydroxyalkanoate synthase